MLEILKVLNMKKVGLKVEELQRLSASDGAANDGFGYSVTISGNVSTIVANGSGSVYIFN